MAEIPGRYLKRVPDGAIYPWTEHRAAKPNFVEYVVPGPGVSAPQKPAEAPPDPQVETAAEAAPGELSGDGAAVLLNKSGEAYATHHAATLALTSRKDCGPDTHEVGAFGAGFGIYRKV